MIKYYIKDGSAIAHLNINKWSPDTRRAFLKEAAEKAKENNYPYVWAQVPEEKARFMEHLGMRFIRNVWTAKGIRKVYCIDSGVFKYVRNR